MLMIGMQQWPNTKGTPHGVQMHGFQKRAKWNQTQLFGAKGMKI